MKENTINQLRELITAYQFFLEEENKNKRFEGWMSYPEFLSEVNIASGKTVDTKDNLRDAISIISIAIESGTLPSNTTPAQLDQLVEDAKTSREKSEEVKTRQGEQVGKWVQNLKKVSLVPVNPVPATTISADIVQVLKVTNAEVAKNPGGFTDKFIRNLTNPTSTAAKILPPQVVVETFAPLVALDVVKDFQDISPVLEKLPRGKSASFLPRENSIGVMSSLVVDINNSILVRAIPNVAQREIFLRETGKSVTSMAAYSDLKKAFVAAYPNLGYETAEFLYPSLPDGKIPSYREPENVTERNQAIEVDLRKMYEIARDFSRLSETAAGQVEINSYIQQQVGSFAKEIGVKEIPLVKPVVKETLLGLTPQAWLYGAMEVYGSEAFISPLLSAYSGQMLLAAPQIALLGAMAGQGVAGGAMVAAGTNVQTLFNITLGQNFLRAGLLPLDTGGAMLGIRAKVGAQVATKFIGLGSQTVARIGSTLAFLANPIAGFVTGAVAGWAIPKIAGLIKKYIVPVFAILGGIVGFAILGPIGAIGGGILGGVAAGGITGGSLSAGVATVTGAFAALGGAFASTLVVPFVVALVGIPVLVAFILFIINTGAYVTPQSTGAIITQPPTGEWSCPNQSIPKPTNVSVTYSSDHQYAFPLSKNNTTSYACYHWDGGLATDIFTSGTNGETRGVQDPVVAYRSGVIDAISTSDSLGGNYVILKADAPDSNGNQYYYYAHLCGLYVQTGNRVGVGDVIATSDNTGNAEDTPEHLHFAMSNTNTFYNGGTFCPQIDFEDRFGFGRCDKTTACVKGAAPLN